MGVCHRAVLSVVAAMCASVLCLGCDMGMGGLGSRSTAATESLVGTVARPFVQKAALADLEERTLDRVNRLRAQQGLVPLRMARDVRELARNHTQDMIDRSELTHKSENGNLVDARANAARIDWQSIAENVARNKGYEDPVDKAVDGWWKSELHRANILNAAMTETGIGVAQGNEGYIYFTQVFIRRMPR